jgi:hypothetical protein
LSSTSCAATIVIKFQVSINQYISYLRNKKAMFVPGVVAYFDALGSRRDINSLGKKAWLAFSATVFSLLRGQI